MTATNERFGAGEARGERRIPVAVLGATGAVGQRFVRLLARHPWFRPVAVTASERSEGRRYRDAVQWVQDAPIPDEVAKMEVLATRPPLDAPLIFSALDASVAGPLEEEFARAGHLVVSNARSHRMAPSVPLLVPEVNPDHLSLLAGQEYGEGGIVTNPNCSTIGLVLALKPLHDAFGLRAIHVVTLQAVSGAGLPGVPALQVTDNVLPLIPGEEEKMERETRKILGTLEGGSVRELEVMVAAQCNRVPVVDGHTECVSVSFRESPDLEDAARVLREFRARPQAMALPSAPRQPVHLLTDSDHPQPRLHRDLEGGMAVAVGRLRPCPLMGLRFVSVSHNTVRGAAGGAILCAELAAAEGVLGPGWREAAATWAATRV